MCFSGLGIFLNTIVGGDIPGNIFERISDMFSFSVNYIKNLFSKD